MDKWKKQDINNLEFEGLCENFYYYKRKMGYGPAAIKEYDANVFICIFKNKEQLISNWEKINYFIAFHVQKMIETIIEKSNFYICLFVNESIGNEDKSKIQGNSFCAKKYVFEEKLMKEKEYLERVESKIFSLGIEKPVGNTFKINKIELQNFRRYEGNLKVDLTGKNKKASAFTLIYAKNGYGKTSLFDGLEYVFKGEVDRIADLIKSNKDLPLKGAIYHNKNCADRPAYSQIELEDGNIIKRNVSAIQDGKNDCRLNKIGKNNGLDIVGTTKDRTKQKERIIDNSKLYSMILFLMKKPDGFDVKFERNSLKEHIEFLKIEEEKKRDELIQYEDYAQIDEADIKQKVSKCDMEIENLQELKKQAGIFENFSPEGIEESINTWEKEKKNYETQLELLYEMQEENGARIYFERYTQICKNIEVQNRNLKNKVLQIQEEKEIYENVKDNLEIKLKDYFSQAIMNEIYQKIDPHEIMKNVIYHLKFNEKDDPQLFIEVCEEEESGKEVYRPETYFSTAQLNTVAFSSFFGRALSADNLSVKTICIDDPIGHFDDMNILGFTDMIRCILEKQDCQIIMSTHEEKVYQIMKRKLDPNFYNTSFIRLDNSEKVVWDKANC